VRAALAAVGVALALAALAHPAVAAGLWSAAGLGPAASFPAARLVELAGAHALLALAGVGGAAAIGVGLGLAATRPAGRPLRPLIEALGAGAQAAPPVVVVALAFPALGFGFAPTAIALVAYATMPILRATIDGIETVPADVAEAARAMGLTRAQRLREIELPLAAPLIGAALRSATVLAVATAAVGALAGAPTLGTPIVLGLQSQNALVVLQGATATASLAFLGEGLVAAALALAGRRRSGGLALG